MVELRNEKLVEQWAHFGLNLETRSGSVPAYQWLHSVAEETHTLPPPSFVCTVGLLLEGELLKSHDTEGMPHGLRRAVRRFEDNLLGRLASSPKICQARDTLALRGYKGKALAYLVGSILERIGFTAGVEVSAGVLRNLKDAAPADMDPQVYKLLEDGYNDLAIKAAECPELITDGDVLVLQHLDVLGNLAQRISARHAVRATEHLREFAPDELAFAQSEGNTPMTVADEDTYPIGGFASVTTSGPIENLVSSELVYMDTKRNGSADLFDLRLSEGDLLYYTRDEALLVRRRRELFIFISDQVSMLRVHDELGTQKSNVLLGLLRLTVERLVEVLGHEDLKIHLVWPYGNKSPDEFQLCKILMSTWIKRGVVEVSQCGSDEDQRQELVRAPGNKAIVRTLELYFDAVPSATLKTSNEMLRIVSAGKTPWPELVQTSIEHLWAS